MGADIHTRAEVYRERYEGGARWVLLNEGIFPYGYYDPTSKYAPFQQEFTECPLNDRNYTLFALLADVRNGRGFAGIPTGDRIEPLDSPRGVPDDASHGWLEEVEQWDVDMHSHTWFTLAELLEPNPLYDQRLVRTGVIPGREYERLRREGGTPDGWSGSISGPKIRTVTPDEYDAGERAEGWTQEEVDEMQVRWREAGLKRGETIEATDERLANYIAEGRTHVQYVWEDNLRESTAELHQMIAALKRYADDLRPLHVYNPADNEADADKPGYYGHGGIPYDSLRVVIGFDN